MLALVWGEIVLAEPRIALVIGNSAYGSVTALDNPSNDARLISRRLNELGFEVTELTDSDQVAMKRAIAQFGRDLRAAGSEAAGLFYYAGHGVQSFGSNYLLPVDISLSDPADLDLLAVEARSVLHQMASAKNKTNIVILDACRNNPFEDLADMDDNGLAEMKAPTGTFLAYATDPGGVALDGEAGNSPFTLSLAEHITVPGLPIEQLFKKVRVDVLNTTRGQQTPWDTSSLTRDFSFAPQQTPIQDFETETSAWQTVSEARDAVQIMLFLRAYPDSEFAPAARDLLQVVMAESFGSAPSVSPESQSAEVAQKPKITDEERLMFDLAADDDTLHAYQTYLQAYPQGAFSDQATERVAALEQAAKTITRKAEAQPAAPGSDEVVTLNSRLTFGNTHVQGKTISDLIKGSPQFPPIEGLPEALWKDQQCSNCHQWTPDTLCTQANTYVDHPAAGNIAKEHPYGGGLKLNLRRWAMGGCQS
ncbi:caspase domain-containing protein [Ruegeria sp. HKCCD8929]|uniref:caspase family protein n=1 Tax=Ruegeria sp. HKCCD8929 TaxID=2683006 RepID=UPI001487AF26|nr:caspase domain-containing protein [Ruegeria sp. HKCCD8929]